MPEFGPKSAKLGTGSPKFGLISAEFDLAFAESCPARPEEGQVDHTLPRRLADSGHTHTHTRRRNDCHSGTTLGPPSMKLGGLLARVICRRFIKALPEPRKSVASVGENTRGWALRLQSETSNRPSSSDNHGADIVGRELILQSSARSVCDWRHQRQRPDENQKGGGSL